MFEGLKQFIALDIPFRAGERTERLSFIQAALDNPVVSPAEKLRQVLDGYAVESEYGRKICLLYTSPSPRDSRVTRMPSSA